MAVPATIADLTTNEATNSPLDSETITASTRPSDYLRAHAAIIKTLEADVATDIATAVSAHAAAADPHTGYALESALGTASTKNTGITSGTVPLVGTKSATDALAGLVELANQAEAEAGTDDTVVMTPLKTAQALGALGLGGTSQAWAVKTIGVDRSSGTPYQNSGSAPIQVAISTVNNYTFVVKVEDANPPTVTIIDQGNSITTMSFIVPPGHYYSVTMSGTVGVTWSELS